MLLFNKFYLQIRNNINYLNLCSTKEHQEIEFLCYDSALSPISYTFFKELADVKVTTTVFIVS